MLADFKKQNFSSVDVETAYFQRGCEQHLGGNAHVGVMLFVSDHPGSQSDLSKHDYSSARSIEIRQRLAHIVEVISSG